MTTYYARRIRFQNGERISVLQRFGGLPVHEATLYLDGLRTRNLASATLHYACMALSVFHKEMDAARIDVMHRFKQGQFLTRPELTRIVNAVRYRMDEDPDFEEKNSKVVSIHRVHPKKKKDAPDPPSVGVQTAAARLRYISDYVRFLSGYVQPSLSKELRKELVNSTEAGIKTLKSLTPRVGRRNTLGSRQGLTIEEQNQLIAAVEPTSPNNPWLSGYVRYRNQIIVLMLLATGMRKGELLGLRVADIQFQTGKVLILRRPDKKDDLRLREPNVKTLEREIAVEPSILKLLAQYINKHRAAIKQARKCPQVFVSSRGSPLSLDSVEKLFVDLRSVLPESYVALTGHVLRHTWNERFSEYADAIGLTGTAEERARAEQQGWSSLKTAQTYTRRYVTRKGNEMSLGLQEKIAEEVKNERK